MAAGDHSVFRPQRDSADRVVPRLAAVGSCPICGAPDSDVLFRSPDMWQGVPGEFTYRRCVSCRTVFQDPRVIPEDIPLCYPDGYYTHARAGKVVGTRNDEQPPGRRFGVLRNWVRKAIVRAVQRTRNAKSQTSAGVVLAGMRGLRERAFFGLLDELIPRQTGAARALDVGCGAGPLMAELSRAGWAVEGLEPDQVAADVARRTSGCRVTVGDLLTTDLPASVFDLVVLSHMFEHLDDPNAALKRIGELLAPTGRAVLIYPNPEGLGARLFKNRWTEWDPPRHLVIPPISAICSAARRNGLRPLSARTATMSTRELVRSRQLQRGVTPTEPPMNGGDRVLKILSNLLVCLRPQLGESIVVSLRKEATASVVGG